LSRLRGIGGDSRILSNASASCSRQFLQQGDDLRLLEAGVEQVEAYGQAEHIECAVRDIRPCPARQLRVEGGVRRLLVAALAIDLQQALDADQEDGRRLAQAVRRPSEKAPVTRVAFPAPPSPVPAPGWTNSLQAKARFLA
jgi:hypothetical protein